MQRRVRRPHRTLDLWRLFLLQHTLQFVFLLSHLEHQPNFFLLLAAEVLCTLLVFEVLKIPFSYWLDFRLYLTGHFFATRLVGKYCDALLRWHVVGSLTIVIAALQSGSSEPHTDLGAACRA